MGNIILAVFVVALAIVGSFVFRCCHHEIDLPLMIDEYYGAGSLKADSEAITPFKVNVPDEVLEDLKARINKARFFDPLEKINFEYGFNTKYLRTVQTHWLNKYDWRQHEKKLNEFPQFMTEIEGMKIHYMRVKPPIKYKKVFPLIIVHGWPGSVWEFYKILPMLTDPQSAGIKSDFAFEVIAPSIPGYGWSDAPKKQGFSAIAAARVFDKMMKRLKFKSYYAQGGDWGSLITTIMAQSYPDRVKGLHVNMAAVSPFDFPSILIRQIIGLVAPSLVLDPADYHKVYPMSDLFFKILQESGYMHIQATKPDTVGFGLNDSPLGLAAYILEKFSTWTNPNYRQAPDGALERHWSLDELLTNIMIYWTTGSIASSQRFYKETFAHPQYQAYQKSPVTVPTGVASFPNELLCHPRNFLTPKFHNLTHYTDMARGGHFGAFEEPKLLAQDVFNFVRNLLD